MLKKKFLTVVIIALMLLGIFVNPTYAVDVPEKNINLKIENLTRGCTVYALIPESLLKYNMNKFVDNNINNSYEAERLKAVQVKKYMDDKDYEGYVDYFLELGFTCGANEIELRHYCFCFGASTEYEFVEVKDVNYLKIKLHLSDIDTFKIILKDYFVNTNTSGIQFMIDEYGTVTYISQDGIPGLRSNETPHILEYNVLYEHTSKEDFESMERTINLTYFIIFFILFLIVLFIVIFAIKKWRAEKKEKEMRKFWKAEVKEKIAQQETEANMEKKERKEYRKQLRKEKYQKKQDLKKAIRLSRMNRKKERKNRKKR